MDKVNEQRIFRTSEKRNYSLKKRPRTLLKWFLFLFVVYTFIGGDSGLYKFWYLRRVIKKEEKAIASLKSENVKLRKNINLLNNDLSYIEKIAREEYGMVKPGEVIYKVILDPPGK